MEINNKVFVVTGGGSGLGRAVALALHKKGAQVALADINTSGMEETIKQTQVNGPNISVHQLDISDKDAVYRFPDQVIAEHGAIDGLLNIAGIIQPFIKLQDLDYKVVDRVMNINFFGSVYMIKAFLPHLLKRPEGYILNTSSMGGFLPVPGQTIYGASKAAIKLLTEGLYLELKDANVHVTLVLPGAMNTNIMNNSGVNNSGTDQQMPANILQPDQAARQMIKAIENNEYRLLLGNDAKMMDKLYRLAPKFAANLIYKQMQSLLKKDQ